MHRDAEVTHLKEQLVISEKSLENAVADRETQLMKLREQLRLAELNLNETIADMLVCLSRFCMIDDFVAHLAWWYNNCRYFYVILLFKFLFMQGRPTDGTQSSVPEC